MVSVNVLQCQSRAMWCVVLKLVEPSGFCLLYHIRASLFCLFCSVFLPFFCQIFLLSFVCIPKSFSLQKDRNYEQERKTVKVIQLDMDPIRTFLRNEVYLWHRIKSLFLSLLFYLFLLFLSLFQYFICPVVNRLMVGT